MATLSRATLAFLVITLLILLGGQPNNTVEAITCAQVVSGLLPCLAYLRNGGPVSPQCCAGVRSVNGAARGTPARRTACGCIKQAATSFGINYGYAGTLPGKCGVSLGYPVKPSIDCNKVH